MSVAIPELRKGSILAQDTEYRIGNILFLALFLPLLIEAYLVLLLILHLHVMEITQFFLLKWFLLGWSTYWEELGDNEA